MNHHLYQIVIGIGINEGIGMRFWVGKVLETRVLSTYIGQFDCVETMLV